MTPRVALLTISDRADLLRDTLTSLAVACGGQLGDPRDSPFVEHVHVDDQHHRLGFAGAIREGWARLAESSVAVDYVFHLEDDWRFDAPLELERMTTILAARRQDVENVAAPDLAQIALLRQPVNAAEVKAGGIVELWPDAYTACELGGYDPPLRWLEHDLFFTTNPSVYRRDLLDLGWPDSSRSEEVFTTRCREAGYRFAFYGASARPRVWHTGNDRREGNGY